MPGFDLRALVKDICDSSALTNDDELTKEVLSQIAPADEHAALEQSLPAFMQRFLSRDHRPLAAPQSTPASQGGTDDQPGSAGGGPQPFRSPKVEGVRSWYQEWKSQCDGARVNVGRNERKFFGDCTLEDLAYISQHRRKLAAANLDAADYVDRVAELMQKHGVKLARQLPEDAVRQLAGGKLAGGAQ
jgi:hypothetical protein